MDSPERSHAAATPVSSEFEDSPVFNFINSLSPIQPVKTVHSIHAYTSPGFSSISSVFSSPHINLQKESRFLIRQHCLESSRQEILSDNGDANNLCPLLLNSAKLSSCAVISQQYTNIKCSLNEATVDPPEDSSSLLSNLPNAVQYDCGSPGHNIAPCYGTEQEDKSDATSAGKELVQFIPDGLDKRKSLFVAEVHEKQLIGQIQDEVPGCDWEDLICNNPDGLLIFDDCTDSKACEDQVEGDKGATCFYSFSSKPIEDVIEGSKNTQLEASFGPCIENMTDQPAILSGDAVEQGETDHTPQLVAHTCQNQAVTHKAGNGYNDLLSSHNKAEPQQQRGMRRRCLVFDAAGFSKRSLHNEAGLLQSDSLPSNENSSDSNYLAHLKRVASPSQPVLPSIGLHLNTLASTSKERLISQETPASERQLMSIPCSIVPFRPRTTKQNSLDKSIAAENSMDPPGNKVEDLHIMQDDTSEAPELGKGEELAQSSSKKKRRKLDNTGDGEACKRCNCKKSKCLKLYCECFAAGIYCIEPCSCQGCYNKPIHEETVLATRKQIESRNPLAFAPKVFRSSDTIKDTGEDANKTPASARHKRGCNCKKSSCLKKYCECFQGGVGCSISCRCEGCKNAFGKKDGSLLTGSEEVEDGKEELDVCENGKDTPDQTQENANVQKDDNVLSESISLTTPLPIGRTTIKMPFFSGRKPPRSSALPIGYSLPNTCQMLKKPEIPLPRCNLGKYVKTLSDGDTPAILRGNASPNSCVKTSSPNGKRVLSPHNGVGLSPSCKGGRRLILKSIPSFPSLNTDDTNEYPGKHAGSPFNCSG